MKHSPRSPFILITVGLIFTLLWGLLVLLFDGQDEIHYHANIAVFINGKKVNFDDAKYMEEETSKCSIDPTKQQPIDRVHFHENDGNLVHVHSAGVAWGHLMSNIRWSFWQDYLIDDTGNMYINSASGSMHFILNGKSIDNPFNRAISSEDRLLIDYGPLTDEVLEKTEFTQVAATAHQANTEDDPSSCYGGVSSNILDIIRNTIFGR